MNTLNQKQVSKMLLELRAQRDELSTSMQMYGRRCDYDRYYAVCNAIAALTTVLRFYRTELTAKEDNAVLESKGNIFEASKGIEELLANEDMHDLVFGEQEQQECSDSDHESYVLSPSVEYMG